MKHCSSMGNATIPTPAPEKPEGQIDLFDQAVGVLGPVQTTPKEPLTSTIVPPHRFDASRATESEIVRAMHGLRRE